MFNLKSLDNRVSIFIEYGYGETVYFLNIILWNLHASCISQEYQNKWNYFLLMIYAYIYKCFPLSL